MNPHVTEETELQELVALVKEELKMLFPMTKRFYLLLKDTALDCDLPAMKEEALICHLPISGLLYSEEKLREKIVVESKG